MERKRIPYGTKLPVKLTLRQRDLILEHSLDDPEYVRIAPADGKGIRVDLSLDEIEDIQGHIAFEANHTEDKKLQKELDALFDKLQKFLDEYDDQGD